MGGVFVYLDINVGIQMLVVNCVHVDYFVINFCRNVGYGMTEWHFAHILQCFEMLYSKILSLYCLSLVFKAAVEAFRLGITRC